METKKPKVFISYVRDDIETAQEIYEFLLQNGCDPWIDRESLLPGQNWERVIKIAIETTDYFLACLSGKSISHDGYFQAELKFAYNIWDLKSPDKIFFIPVKLNPCEIPHEIKKIHCVDWSLKNSRKSILKAIGIDNHLPNPIPHTIEIPVKPETIAPRKTVVEETKVPKEPDRTKTIIPSETAKPKIIAPEIIIPKQKLEEITIPLPDLPADAKPLEMILIPAGSFLMGSTDDVIAKLIKESGWDGHKRENPQHRVTISQPFYIGKYPITQAQWQVVMGNNPSHFKGMNLPVETVSWNVCQTFIQKLNGMNQGSFRLPSEAEWEYACRADASEPTKRFYWGDDPDYSQIKDYAWFEGNSGYKTHEVGLKKPNAWGLYDMSGNVGEWCEDEWHDNYKDAPQNGGARITNYINSFTNRVIRGGSWYDIPRYCRSAYRSYGSPDSRYYGMGFRIVSSRT